MFLLIKVAMILLSQVRTIAKAETLFLLLIFGGLILRVYSIVDFCKLCLLQVIFSHGLSVIILFVTPPAVYGYGLGVRNLFHFIHKIG